MSDIQVTQLWCYPVKSMQGRPVDSAEITPDGLVGDRRWGLIDAETGKLMSAKRWSKLLMAQAVADDGEVTISLPDGGTVRSGDGDASEALSRWLGRTVELREVSPDVEVAYEMTLDPPNDDAELFDVPAPKGSFLDLTAVHLLSAATLAGGAEAYPTLDWDVRRFRPNIVVDGDVDAFGEDTWTGRQVQVGSAVLQVRQPTVRCAMPLRAQPGLAREREMFDALNELHHNHFGVYVDVVEAGHVAVGDEVTVLPR